MTSRRRHAARFLDDARIRIGITYGLTDYRARLGSEGEVVALGFGNYCFAESVYEITLHPRPASRGFTGAVETDQPRGPSLEGAAVTLWNCHSRATSTRASQTTTFAPRPPFPAADTRRVESAHERCDSHRPRRTRGASVAGTGDHPRHGARRGSGARDRRRPRSASDRTRPQQHRGTCGCGTALDWSSTRLSVRAERPWNAEGSVSPRCTTRAST